MPRSHRKRRGGAPPYKVISLCSWKKPLLVWKRLKVRWGAWTAKHVFSVNTATSPPTRKTTQALAERGLALLRVVFTSRTTTLYAVVQFEVMDETDYFQTFLSVGILKWTECTVKRGCTCWDVLAVNWMRLEIWENNIITHTIDVNHGAFKTKESVLFKRWPE